MGSVSSLTPEDQQLEVKTSTKGETQRALTHYQFTGWPDFGAPLSPSPLLTLVRKVRSAVKSADGPILVHCRLVRIYFYSLIVIRPLMEVFVHYTNLVVIHSKLINTLHMLKVKYP